MKIYLTLSMFKPDRAFRFDKLKNQNGYVSESSQLFFTYAHMKTERDYIYPQHQTHLNLKRMSRFD